MRWVSATRAALLASAGTFVVVYGVVFVLSGLSAPLGALYVAVMSVSAIFLSVVCSGVYYGFLGTRYWLASYLIVAGLSAIILSIPLIHIPRVDTSVAGSTITRQVPEIATLGSSVSVLASLLVVSFLANGLFWIIIKRGDRHARN
jgi:hypothetical protein